MKNIRKISSNFFVVNFILVLFVDCICKILFNVFFTNKNSTILNFYLPGIGDLSFGNYKRNSFIDLSAFLYSEISFFNGFGIFKFLLQLLHDICGIFHVNLFQSYIVDVLFICFAISLIISLIYISKINFLNKISIFLLAIFSSALSSIFFELYFFSEVTIYLKINFQGNSLLPLFLSLPISNYGDTNFYNISDYLLMILVKFWLFFISIFIFLKIYKYIKKYSKLNTNILLHDRSIPISVRRQVYYRDNGTCNICGTNENIHFDHIIPFSKGGSSKLAKNIQLLCARHNLEKGANI